MTTASADILLETQELGKNSARRGRIAKVIGVHVIGRAVKKAADSVRVFVRERPAIPVTAGTVLMATGMAVVGTGLIDAGEQMGRQASDTMYAAVASERVIAPPAHQAELSSTAAPIGSGSASFAAGGVLAAYGLRTSRRRDSVTDKR